MELKEAIKKLKDKADYQKMDICKYPDEQLVQAIEIVLQALDNSIPEKKIEDKKKELEEKYNNSVNDVYKEPIEALIDFQRIVGAKNTLKELLEENK